MITAHCRGGRTPKKQSLLQAFMPLWFGLETRREWLYLNKFESRAPSLVFAGQNLFVGLYINELLYHGLQQNEPEVALYDAYEAILSALTLTDDRLIVEAMLRRFEWIFLSVCGYQLSFTYDAHLSPILADKHYTFIPNEGFICTEKAIPGHHILAFRDNVMEDLAVLKSAKWIARRAIDFALGEKRILARELVRK